MLIVIASVLASIVKDFGDGVALNKSDRQKENQ